MFKVVPFKTGDVKDVKGADLLEVWFDQIPDADVSKTLKILQKIKKPFIYKVEQKGLEEFKKDVIKNAAYLDLDVETTPHKMKHIRRVNTNAKIIISFHDYKKTPDTKDLKKILKQMQSKGADITKFATHAKGVQDSIKMLDFLSELREKGQKAICLCMGKDGILTRTTGHLFGNYCSYFALDEKSKTAPGQITLKECDNSTT